MNIDKGHEALDLFGKIIVSMFKDSVLENFEFIKNDKYGVNTPEIGLAKTVSSLTKETQEIIRDCIINAIATGIHDFLLRLSELHSSNNEGIKIIVNGVDIISISDGINAEYMSPLGWEARFSEYPTNEEVLKKYIIKYGLEMPPLLEDYPE